MLELCAVLECMFHLCKHFGYNVWFFLVGAQLLAMTSTLKVLHLLRLRFEIWLTIGVSERLRFV